MAPRRNVRQTSVNHCPIRPNLTVFRPDGSRRRIESIPLPDDGFRYLTVNREPPPAPAALDPSGPMDRVECIAWYGPRPGPSNPTPARPARDHCPSKPEYVRSFAASGELPGCVRVTRMTVFADLVATMTAMGDDARTLPRRYRQAIARYDFDDLSCTYDAGLLGRIRHYATAHQDRGYLSEGESR